MRTLVTVTIFGLIASISVFNLFRENTTLKINQNRGDRTILVDTSSTELPAGYEHISNFTLNNYTRTVSFSQDNNGTMLFADKKGIIFFDGSNESFFSIDASPNKIKKTGVEDLFFVACAKGYGVLKKKATGQYEYNSLSTQYKNNENYFDIVFSKDQVIFVSEKKLVQLNINTLEKSEIIYQDDKRLINSVFVFKNQLYINFYRIGLHSLNNKKLLKVLDDSLFTENQILCAIPFENSIILGLSNNSLIKFTGKDYTFFKTTSEEYIQESIITGAEDYLSDRFVLMTLNGGALIINKKTGETGQTINYRTGLPDDEIFAAFTDSEGGLWLSHEYGISRVAFDLPVKNFGIYPGLQGKINSSIINNNTLFIGTGEGLFYLSEIKNYEEVKVATDKWVKTVVKPEMNSTVNEEEVIEEVNDNTVNANTDEESGFLNKWKKRKEDKKKEKEEKEILIEKLNQGIYPDVEVKKNNDDEIHEIKTELKKVTEYRKIYELQSVKYTYKKVDGINSKCRKLMNYNDALLAGTNSGLFLIKNKKVTTIIPDDNIYTVSGPDEKNKLLVTTSKGIYRISESGGEISVLKFETGKFETVVFKNILIVNDTAFWASSSNMIYLINTDQNRIISSEQFKINTDVNEEIKILKTNNTVIFFDGNQAFYYNEKKNSILPDIELNNKISTAKLFFPNDEGVLIIDKTITYLGNQAATFNNIKFLNLLDNINGTFISGEDIWAFTRDNLIFRITNETIQSQPFHIYINSVEDNTGEIPDINKEIRIKSDYKKLRILLSSPCYLKDKFITYYYATDTKDENGYIKASGSEVIIPELGPGEHTVYFYALNGLNDKSNILELKLVIKPPFWQSYKFIVGTFILFIVLLFLGMSAYYKRKQRKINQYNEILETKVQERTAEISKQNELIRKQNDEIMNQNEMIVFQHEEITGSIRYAEKIQKAVLSDIEIHSKFVAGIFNLFRPRDIVSGDFYWIYEVRNKLLVAAADCTGHGVPGGFLSMLGISFLNEIVNEQVKSNTDIKAAEILNALRIKVISTLSRNEEDTAQDGMDISIVIIDSDTMTMNFAGANNPAYLARNGILNKIEADRMPVGYNKKLNRIGFKNKYVKLKPDDSVYIFTDGFADQFGGEHNKKFNVRRFKELLIHLQKFPINEQKSVAEKILMKWQKGHMQIDDILLIGIQI